MTDFYFLVIDLLTLPFTNTESILDLSEHETVNSPESNPDSKLPSPHSVCNEWIDL